MKLFFFLSHMYLSVFLLFKMGKLSPCRLDGEESHSIKVLHLSWKDQFFSDLEKEEAH